MFKPQVSVIMSVYNGERYVREAIDSILKQTFKDFEFLIINDGSTDSTGEILKSYRDPRIKIINNKKNIGLTKSLNKVLQLAKGDYIARQDADDISLPRRLELQAKFLNKNTDCALVGSSYYKIDENGAICSHVKVLSKHTDIKEGLKQQNWFGHGCTMMRRAVLHEVKGYDEKYKFSQDYDLWIRISENYEIANIKKPLYCWRMTASGISKDKEAEQKSYAKMVITEAQRREGRRILRKIDQPHVMVSVIVPTFNRPVMLTRTINSILKQTYQDFEIIVVNDAGRSVENIIRLLDKNNRITYLLHTKNRGLAASRNTGIKESKGKYIAYLDDDDVYYPDHLETLVNFLEDSEYKVAYTDTYRVHQRKERGKYVTTKKEVPYSFDFNYDRIFIENFIPVPCLMHEKSCLNEVGLFDEKLTVLEDWDLLIRLSRKFKFFHIKKITSEVIWRTDATTMTSEKPLDFYKVRKMIYEKYGNYSKTNLQIVNSQNEKLAHMLVKTINIVEEIYASRTWKVAIFATSPWRWIKSITRRIASLFSE